LRESEIASPSEEFSPTVDDGRRSHEHRLRHRPEDRRELGDEAARDQEDDPHHDRECRAAILVIGRRQRPFTWRLITRVKETDAAFRLYRLQEGFGRPPIRATMAEPSPSATMPPLSSCSVGS